jgi:hypothetical protein
MNDQIPGGLESRKGLLRDDLLLIISGLVVGNLPFVNNVASPMHQNSIGVPLAKINPKVK